MLPNKKRDWASNDLPFICLWDNTSRFFQTLLRIRIKYFLIRLLFEAGLTTSLIIELHICTIKVYGCRVVTRHDVTFQIGFLLLHG